MRKFYGSILLVAALGLLSAGMAGAWQAYNDVVVDNDGVPLPANATRYNIGNGSPGPSSGLLKNWATGANLGVTATLTQSGGVVYQPGDSAGNPTAGSETNAGTDAYNLFTSVGVRVKGLVYYGSTGWYVDLAFTGLDSAKSYEFVTTTNRNGGTSGDYPSRLSTYTISDADAFTNTSSDGTGAGASTTFCTGHNTVNGYVARWAGISPGADGDFRVRAANGNPSLNKGYAFSVFRLTEEVIPEPSGFIALAMGAAALLGWRRLRK